MVLLEEYKAVRSPELLHIADGAAVRYGANQEWYRSEWRRKAGCGPTTCSHLLCYLAATRPQCAPLFGGDGASRAGFLELMEQVWHYVTPGKMGVNSSSIFTAGALRFGEERGVRLRYRVLEVPTALHARPQMSELSGFLSAAMADDLPVAFLNLSNGSLKNLDSWHWVTLTAYNPQTGAALMYDQGERSVIELELWLRTTRMGGALVVLEPGDGPAQSKAESDVEP